MKRLTTFIPLCYLWIGVITSFALPLSVNALEATDSEGSIPQYQLCLWTKAGIKTGYLSSDHPHFSLVGEYIRFTTDKVTFDIAIKEFDRFTLEQVIPEEPQGNLRFFVWLRNGVVHGYDLEDNPLVTLGETVFTLTTTKLTMEYQATDILRFTLQDEAIVDQVPAVPLHKALDNVQFREGMLFLCNGTPDSAVRIYDTAGRLVRATKADAEGNLSLSLASFRTGIYIIKTEKTTIKIQKR